MRQLKVVGYTTAPWDHALALLRMVSPYKYAGIELIQGTQQENIYTEKVSDADLVLIYRDFPRHQNAYERILSLARAQSKPVVFDIDDHLLGLPSNHPDRLSHYYAPALFPMLSCILEADGVTAVSTTLADVLRPINPNVWALPNYTDDEIWDLTPREEEVDDGVVTIGYMGGDSHAPDFDLVIPVLVELLQSYQDKLALKLVGMKPFSILQALPNVTWIPFQFNYPDYTRFVRGQNFDIMIAPERDILFNRSKGSTKFQEASALSLPGIYSDTLPFKEQVTHGVNGFLVATPEEWKNSLVKLIENKSLRQRIGLAALSALQKDWLISKNAFKWMEVYQQVLSSAGQHNTVERIPTELFSDLNHQTQMWLLSVNDEIEQSRLQAKEIQTTLLEKEEYISSLIAQIESYRNSLPGRLWRATRRAYSIFNSRKA